MFSHLRDRKMAASFISNNSSINRTNSLHPNSFLFSGDFELETLVPTQFFYSTNELFSDWNPTWNEHVALDPGAESTAITQANTSSEYDNPSTAPLQILESLPYVLEGLVPQTANASIRQKAAETDETHETINIDKPQEVASVHPSVDSTQSVLEQSEPESDSLIGSFINPIVFDDIGDQESNINVDLLLSRSAADNSFYLKRKRSISDDWILTKDETKMESYLVGSHGYNTRQNPKRAVRSGYVDSAIIEELFGDPDVTVSEEADDTYWHSKKKGRRSQL